jgi:hypothetical protein
VNILGTCATFVVVTAVTVSAQSWKDRLESELKAIYPVTKRSMMDTNRITQRGIVLQVAREGITADLGSDLRFSVTRVEGEETREQGGSVLALFGAKKTSRTFKEGERVHVLGVKVDDDYVMLQIQSVEMSDYNEKGSTRQTRYKGAVSFRFDPKQLAAMTATDVKGVIDKVLPSEADASAPATIALGQSRQEVEKIMGKPEQIIDLGVKVTYVYKTLKVIFVDGKVADVQ